MVELKDYNGKKYASAMDLYKALGIKKKFATWFKQNAERAMLDKSDFVPYKKQSTGGRPSTDYYLIERAAMDLILMSGGKNAKQVRAELIKAFQERQTGVTLDGDQIRALTEIVKAMTLVSSQKFAEKKHFDFYNHPESWWKYRADILGYSKQSLTDALAKVNKRFSSTKKALIKLDPAEIIRTGTIDLLIALGKPREYAMNVAGIAKIIAETNGYDKEIWDDTKADPLRINGNVKQRQALLDNYKNDN